MLVRLKLKCPTCWAETYVVVDEDVPGDQESKISELTHRNHDTPEVVRRETEGPMEWQP